MVTSGYLNHIELGLNMKLNRNTKKWNELYNKALSEIILKKGKTTTKHKFVDTSYEVDDYKIEFYVEKSGWFSSDLRSRMVPNGKRTVFSYGMGIHTIDAMPDRIKEAEEYADEIYKALR